MKKYQLVYDVPPPERFASKSFTAEDLIAGMQAMGYTSSGVATGSHLHLDLIGEPRFAKLCGPMHNGVEDGVTVIRYETPPVCNFLSHD